MRPQVEQPAVGPAALGPVGASGDGHAVIKGGKTIRVRCQDCRLCIDGDPGRWERVKARYAGAPGEPA